MDWGLGTDSLPIADWLGAAGDSRSSQKWTWVRLVVDFYCVTFANIAGLKEAGIRPKKRTVTRSHDTSAMVAIRSLMRYFGTVRLWPFSAHIGKFEYFFNATEAAIKG